MATHQIDPDVRKHPQPNLWRARLRSIKRENPSWSHESARVDERQEPRKRSTTKVRTTDSKDQLPLPTPRKKLLVQDPIRKPKRFQSNDTSLSPITRPQTRTSTCHTVDEDTADALDGKKLEPIDYWVRSLHWPPKEYFEDLASESNMNHLLAASKSYGSFRETPSTESSTAPTSQRSRDTRSVFYKKPSYEFDLAKKMSFMKKSELGITDESKNLCNTLIETEQPAPLNTLFRDEVFEKTCDNLQGRNEAMVVRDLTLLLCPSAKILHINGSEHLKDLHESVNEAWNRAIPFHGTRPQPDYSVGFGESAFRNDQLEKINSLVGELGDTFTSYFMATSQMHFPFLTCEVKGGAVTALDIADRQNAHSMTLAVRGVVELFKSVKREEELHREIVAFSISHDHRTVRIYGHYPVISNGITKFYRHHIHSFDFTALGGKEKWTAYQFVKNVYDIWVPLHLKRLCSVIDALPSDINLDVPQLDESTLSGSMGSYSLSSQDVTSLDETHSQQGGDRGVPPLEEGVVEGRARKKQKRR